MAHPLQHHFDRVSALLSELRAALEDHEVFRSRREAFDEYFEANELELALHSACDALLENPFDKPSAEVLKKIEDVHKAMELRDDCVEKLLPFDLGAGKTLLRLISVGIYRNLTIKGVVFSLALYTLTMPRHSTDLRVRNGEPAPVLQDLYVDRVVLREQ